MRQGKIPERSRSKREMSGGLGRNEGESDITEEEDDFSWRRVSPLCARAATFYAQKRLEERGVVRYARFARTINYLLIPSKKPVQVQSSGHTDVPRRANAHARTHTRSPGSSSCFIDTYDGTLSGRSCFKPQRDLTEKRHTLLPRDRTLPASLLNPWPQSNLLSSFAVLPDFHCLSRKNFARAGMDPDPFVSSSSFSFLSSACR